MGWKAIAIIVLFFSNQSFGATGDTLYQNCDTGGCSGALVDTHWVRTVETSGCHSGECLKLVGLQNESLYGAGNTSINTSGIAGKNEITVVYYTKFSEPMGNITAANFKSIRPYVGGGNYYMATITGWNTGGNEDFYISLNYGTVQPSSIFTIRGPRWVGDTAYAVSNGDGTWNLPEGRLAGSFNQGGYDGFGTQWTKVRQWIKLPSSTSGTDGESKLWVNDELAFHLYNSHMTATQATFSEFTFYPSSEATETFEQWMDDMVVYEGYVPPSGEPLDVCDSSHLNLCTTQTPCIAAGGYWWSDSTCHASQEVVTPPASSVSLRGIGGAARKINGHLLGVD